MNLINQWKKLAHKTSNGISYVILSIFFIFVLTPYGIVIRKVVNLLPKKTKKSQWVQIEPRKLDSYLNQF